MRSPMSTLLIKNADVLVTMDDQRREISHADLLVTGGVVTEIGVGLAVEADTVIDAAGCVVTPGLVNTHHHLVQTLTRAVPAGQDALLFGWLQSLYPIWARMGPEHVYTAAQIGLAELALSGCTMSSDHLYLFPNGARLEDEIEGAKTIGIRFHATRGSMSIGESKGGLPPDILTEDENAILQDCIRVVDAHHDPSEGAMIRVGLAPCSPFSVSCDLMRETALLARDKGVMMHTHLAENDEDIAYSLANFGCRPGQYAEELGWVGDDVWHAHCVKLNAEEIDLFAHTRTGIAHCPCSNCRLGSGIAPVREWRDAGVKVGLGVDGSASNDSGHLLGEARQAMLMQRVKNGADAMSAREALEIATRGGAEVLGRPECGVLAPGKRADFAIWDMTTIESAGAWDPVAALIFCGPFTPRDLFVDGKAVVSGGNLVTADLGEIVHRARSLTQKLTEAN
jgi:cytosine/adenosine deaminase-related metal-dependent hydrolase